MATFTQVAAALDVPGAACRRSTIRKALTLTLGLRLFYSLLAAVFSPGLRLDSKLIQSNSLTEHLIDRAAHPCLYALLGVWERFDTLWYLNIARHGYDRPAATVFYPLYPALIRGVSFFVPSAWAASLLVASLLVSTAASFFLIAGALRLFELDAAPGASLRTILLWFAWPASFIFFAGYPDSLLCALVVWSMYLARTQRWYAAGALGMLAGCAKAVGCFTALPLLWIAWTRRERAGLPAAALCCLGVALFQGWLMLRHFPSAVETYRTYWRTTTEAPWTSLAGAAATVAHGGDLLLVLNLAVLMIAGAAALSRTVRFEYRLFAGAALWLFLTKHTDPLLQSTMRYSLTLFPAFSTLSSKLRSGIPLAAALLVSTALNILLFRIFLDWGLVV